MVSLKVAEANARLARDTFQPLSAEEVDGYLTIVPRIPAGSRLRPYLVRGLIPNRGGKAAGSWHGDILYVFGYSLGCTDEIKQPLVIYLSKPPRRVVATTMSAL